MNNAVHLHPVCAIITADKTRFRLLFRQQRSLCPFCTERLGDILFSVDMQEDFPMKKILVIGSTVVDVIIDVDHLPRTQEDVHVIRQTMSLGGCAYNTSDMVRHFGVPYILFSPVGTGAYGDFVRTQLAARGIQSPIPTPEQDNGCCYCFVERTGERTFISYHGAEYLFEKEWFDLINDTEIDSVYICGLEIEESTGVHIVEWLEAHPQLTIYFAPGPRISKIAPQLLERIFALHPVLHLNEDEACTYAAARQEDTTAAARASVRTSTAADVTAQDSVPLDTTAPSASGSGTSTPLSLEAAAALLFDLTQNAVIVTLGERGAYCHTAEGTICVPGFPAHQIDTIGAGDSHIGAVMACRQLGMSLSNAVRTANRVAAKVVETKGALLPPDAFRSIVR